MSTAALPYLSLEADERLEFRLPALLKQRLAEVAARRGQTVSEYIVQVLASDVSAELTKGLEWQLTAPESLEFLRLLMSPAPETATMAAARERAAALLGTSSAT